jgi:hypothetical protein
VYDSIIIRERRRPQNLLVREKNFEGIPSVTYMGALINRSNDINQSIKERIEAMDWAYCAGFCLFKNQLIDGSTNVKIYSTLVHPVVRYGAETWSCTVADKNAHRFFERRIFRKVFGPVRDRGEWRIRHNEVLNELIEGRDIVRFMKPQRIRWLGYVERISEEWMSERMLKGRLFSKRRRDDHVQGCWTMWWWQSEAREEEQKTEQARGEL